MLDDVDVYMGKIWQVPKNIELALRVQFDTPISYLILLLSTCDIILYQTDNHLIAFFLGQSR